MRRGRAAIHGKRQRLGKIISPQNPRILIFHSSFFLSTRGAIDIHYTQRLLWLLRKRCGAGDAAVHAARVSMYSRAPTPEPKGIAQAVFSTWISAPLNASPDWLIPRGRLRVSAQ